MPAWLPILLFLAGLALVAAEVFFPSFGLLTILAASCLVGGIYLAFEVSATYGTISVISIVMLAPMAWYWAMKWLPRTSFGNRMLASGPSFVDAESRRGTSAALARFEGQTGRALSMLRPSGTAEILDERLDVITRGEIIEAGEPIAVVEVSGNRVIVASAAAPRVDEYSD